MAGADLISFGDYAPDISDLDTGFSSNVLNVVPRADGYGPFQDLVSFTSTLPSACRGYFFARKSDGSIAMFAGTSTDLYLLNNTTFAWTLVSKGNASYSTLVSSDNWQFAQFNNLVYACQINSVLQVYLLGSSSNFADNAGSPPQASHIAIVNRFIFLSGLLSNSTRIQWCDLNNTVQWTAGTGLADFQDLPDGGTVHGMLGGDNDGIVFQDASIRRVIFAPGSAVVFEIIRLSKDDGLFAQYSAVTAGDRVFFISPQGFKMILPGGYPTPIGKERVDRTFFADVDVGNLQLVIAAADPSVTRVYWAYKSISGNAGLFDKVICYDWSIGKNGRFTTIKMTGEYLASLAKPGLTLENLDTLAPGKFTISGAANNGSGAIRLTLNAVTNAYTTLANENTVVVYGVTGTTEANGTWAFTIVDPTHIDLVGSTFTNAYSSGGNIGGSLDALPFSLDSISTASTAQLSAVSSSHAVGFFTGSNLEATMETPEQDGGGVRAKVNGLRPFTDSSTVMMSLGVRNTEQDAITYTTETGRERTGLCGARVDARYMRAKMRIPYGTTWTYAMGVRPEDVRATGRR